MITRVAVQTTNVLFSFCDGPLEVSFLQSDDGNDDRDLVG